MIQFNIAQYQCKKNLIWIIIFLLFLILKIIILKNSVNVEQNDILSLIGYTDRIELLLVYKIAFIIFFTYSFYTFELNYIFEFIFLRLKQSQWIMSKLLAVVLCFSIFNLLHTGLVLFAFSNQIDFSLNFILTYFLFDVFLCILEITFINLFKSKNFILIISIILGLILFENFHVKIFLVLFPILIIINILYIAFFKKLEKIS